jgi:two-component system, cell cycle sensor histidine kinase and response regulator CckA
VRTLVHRVLSDAGYTLLTARDGQEALDLFDVHAARIDLVLTDLLMPRLGGRVLTEHLRTARPDLPVVAMSGYTDPADP